MRLTAALALPLILSLAACGGGKPKGVVRFTGLAPNSAAQKAKDPRVVTVTCPGSCEKKDGTKVPISFGAENCGTKGCIEKLLWDKSFTCPSCNGGGSCSACALLEQKDGKCFDCAGTGIKTYAGKTPECPNCKGKKVCPICEGSKKCDYCKGEGKLDDATVRDLASKAAPKPESDEDAKPKKAEAEK
ncbi:MAG TPA: hypothetical protein VF950_23890 [Planctomycetota bacterium]